jgi:hypothetical protein
MLDNSAIKNRLLTNLIELRYLIEDSCEILHLKIKIFMLDTVIEIISDGLCLSLEDGIYSQVTFR